MTHPVSYTLASTREFLFSTRQQLFKVSDVTALLRTGILKINLLTSSVGIGKRPYPIIKPSIGVALVQPICFVG